MSTSWITTSYESWLKGHTISLADSITAHRLPLFPDLTLCITGVEDVAMRGKMYKLIEHFDGGYSKGLSQNCTHLICGTAESEKITWAQSVNDGRRKARKGKSSAVGEEGEVMIHIVWEEWFWDCIEFGGTLHFWIMSVWGLDLIAIQDDGPNLNTTSPTPGQRVKPFAPLLRLRPESRNSPYRNPYPRRRYCLRVEKVPKWSRPKK